MIRQRCTWNFLLRYTGSLSPLGPRTSLLTRSQGLRSRMVTTTPSPVTSSLCRASKSLTRPQGSTLPGSVRFDHHHSDTVPSLRSLTPVPPPIAVLSTQLDPSSRRLRIRWVHGDETLYPYSWLRDCCQCSSCFHQTTTSKIVQLAELNLNEMPVLVEADPEAQELAVTWSDEHRSVFNFKWLLEHGFGNGGPPSRRPILSGRTGRTRKLWNSNLRQDLKTIDFQKILKDDRAVYDWLTELEQSGIVLITNVPQVEGQLEKVAARVAFVRMTCFGPTMLVRNKDYRGNAAYTTTKLELHNDLVYYNSIPGVKMVHCIQEQTTGEKGRSLFVDGFLAAEKLKQDFPDQFHLLTSICLNYYGIGKDYLDYHLHSRHPTIRLDDTGEVTQVVYNSKARHSLLNLDTEKVEPFYAALKNFAEILNSPDHVTEIHLRAGDIVCLDNWRVLHGLAPFEVIPGSEAVVQRAYLDWDEAKSTRRVLHTELEIPDEDY